MMSEHARHRVGISPDRALQSLSGSPVQVAPDWRWQGPVKDVADQHVGETKRGRRNLLEKPRVERNLESRKNVGFLEIENQRQDRGVEVATNYCGGIERFSRPGSKGSKMTLDSVQHATRERRFAGDETAVASANQRGELRQIQGVSGRLGDQIVELGG